MRKSYFKLITFSVIFTALFFYSCDTVNDIFGNDTDPESGILTPEKYSLVPGEIVAINADFDLETGTVTGYIDMEEVSFDIIDNSIYFLTPDLSPGAYMISLSLNDVEYSINIDITSVAEISDPSVYVERAQTFGVDLVEISAESDALLQESGIIDSVQANENQIALQASLNKSNQILTQMTVEEKAEFARIYSANEYWIVEFQQIFYSTTKSSQCESLLEQGNNALNAGNMFEANDLLLKYKLCQIDYYANNRLVYYLNKFNKLIDELSNDNNKSTTAIGIVPAAFAIAFVYFVWTRFDAKLKEMNSNPLAEDLEDEKLSVETFSNNQKANYSKRVRFRAVDQNDINREDLFGKFVGMIHDANEAIKKLLSLVSDSDIKPVTLANSSQSIDFNRNFVIQNISNPNVTLKSTEFTNDLWGVVFETEMSEEQEFTYELMYNDGHSQLTRQFSAILALGDPLLGEWEAYEVDGQPVGEWQYYYLGDCSELIGWASITHKATLTLDGSNIMFYYDGSDKEYQYTGLDYTTCTYQSLNINESTDDDSYTSTYTLDGNKIIVQTNDGPFPMTYQLTDQNNTLIVTADGEINKYHRAK